MNLTPVTSFDDVYQIETTDSVLGGAGGIANLQALSLTNRTEWLKEQSGIWLRAAGIITASNGFNILDSHAGAVINGDTASANIAINFNDISVLTANNIFFIKCMGGKSLTINPASGNSIIWGGTTLSKLYLHDGEFVKIIVGSTALEILDCSATIVEVGDGVLGIMERRGTLLKDGRVVNRADYPRLWNFVSDTSHSYFNLVSASLWGSSQTITNDAGATVTVYPYKGCFHTGDGSTTFGLPDERGMSDRYLDLSRGIDAGRIYEKVGGYEHDGFPTHSHEQQSVTAIGNGGNKPAGYLNTLDDLAGHGYYTKNTGGVETRVKNVAKLPLIKI